MLSPFFPGLTFFNLSKKSFTNHCYVLLKIINIILIRLFIVKKIIDGLIHKLSEDVDENKKIIKNNIR